MAEQGRIGKWQNRVGAKQGRTGKGQNRAELKLEVQVSGRTGQIRRGAEQERDRAG